MESMNAEQNVQLWEIVGNFGKYQFAILSLNFATSFFLGYIRVLMELLAPSVDLYWDWETFNHNKTIFESTSCKMADIFRHNSTSSLSNSSSKLIYSTQYSRRTLTEEFNLICERSWLVSFASTVILIGLLIGGVITGWASEIYGRTRCTQWTSFLCLFSNILMLFSQGYTMFVLAALIFGATGPTTSSYIFFQIIEMTPPNWSEFTGVFSKAGELFGQALMVGIAWILKDWFHTQIVLTVFTGVLSVSLFYALESPMWLAVRGKYEQAEQTMNRIIVRNGLDPVAAKPKIKKFLAQMKLRCEITSDVEKGRFSDLFKNRTIAFHTIAGSASRSFAVFMYISLVMNAETFGSGLYLDLMISSLLALACFLISMVLLKKFSLRTLMIFLSLCGGASCILYIFLLKNLVAQSALVIMGRCFMSPISNMIVVFLNQITPTSVRGISFGFRSAVSGLISALTPFTKELGQLTTPYVPFIVFAVCGFATAGLLKLLPETRGKELIHTVDELVKSQKDVPNEVPTVIYTVQARQNVQFD